MVLSLPGRGFNPWSGNEDPTSRAVPRKKKERKEERKKEGKKERRKGRKGGRKEERRKERKKGGKKWFWKVLNSSPRTSDH